MTKMLQGDWQKEYNYCKQAGIKMHKQFIAACIVTVTMLALVWIVLFCVRFKDPKIIEEYEPLQSNGEKTAEPEATERYPLLRNASVNLSLLDIQLITKMATLTRLAALEGIQFRITCGFRSQAAQDALYAKGRTEPGRKVTWTRKSKHRLGRAVDIVVLTASGITWKPEDYYELGVLGESIGLVWGGGLGDYGHFELE